MRCVIPKAKEKAVIKYSNPPRGILDIVKDADDADDEGSLLESIQPISSDTIKELAKANQYQQITLIELAQTLGYSEEEQSMVSLFCNNARTQKKVHLTKKVLSAYFVNDDQTMNDVLSNIITILRKEYRNRLDHYDVPLNNPAVKVSPEAFKDLLLHMKTEKARTAFKRYVMVERIVVAHENYMNECTLNWKQQTDDDEEATTIDSVLISGTQPRLTDDEATTIDSFLISETAIIKSFASAANLIDLDELQHKRMNHCYIIYVGVHLVNGIWCHVFKYGRSEKIKDRLHTHSNSFNTHDLICIVCAKSGAALEYDFKKWLESNRLTASINRTHTELFCTSAEFPLLMIYQKFMQLASLGVSHDTQDMIIEMQAQQIESLTKQNEAQAKQIDQLLSTLGDSKMMMK